LGRVAVCRGELETGLYCKTGKVRYASGTYKLPCVVP